MNGFGKLAAALLLLASLEGTAALGRPIDPVQQTALDHDAEYARLEASLDATPDDDAYLARELDIVRYVAQHYGIDSALYAYHLDRAISVANVTDYNGTNDALLRRWTAAALPVLETKLGKDDPHVSDLREWRASQLYEDGQPDAAEALLGKPVVPQTQEAASNSPIDEYYREPQRTQLHRLEDARNAGLEGDALLANLAETARIQKSGMGIYWNDYWETRVAIIEEMLRLGRPDAAIAEASAMVSLYQEADSSSDNNLMTLFASQYLAYALAQTGDYQKAAEVLESQLASPMATEFQPEDLLVPFSDPIQPEWRLPQAKSQLARLLLEGHGDAGVALDQARFATRYLRAFRAAQGFGSDDEQRITEAFARPDEPMGEDARQQFANLVEAAWRVDQAAGGSSPALAAEAFVAAQDAMQDRTTRAIAQTAAQAAASRAGFAKLAAERANLADRMAQLQAEMDEYGPDDAAYIEADRAYRQARARQGQLDLDLRAAAPAYFRLIRPEPLSVKQAQALLRPGEALLLVLPTEFGTNLFAVTTRGITWRHSKLTDGELADYSKLLRLDLDPWGSGIGDLWDGGYDLKTAHMLYAELIEPLMPALKDSDTLLYATGPALSTLPLTVLAMDPPAPGAGRMADLSQVHWLADRFAFAQLPSLSSLAYLRGDQRREVPDGQKLDAFGDPRLAGESVRRGARGGGAVGRETIKRAALAGVSGYRMADVASLRSLPGLPGTATEIREIASVLGAPPSSVHLLDAASEGTIKTIDLSRDRYIAFATHGLLAGEGGIAPEPGLVLTPPAKPSMEDDGLLTASEIMQLRLSADWVILSACNTAAGDGEGGPGLSGLARAFFFAGAHSLLASHWPVRDDIAPLLTGKAVGLLARDPSLSRAQALQRAMREVRANKQIPEADHPSSWGPFITVGDPR